MENEYESCGRCGRKLTTLKSKVDGYGPVCRVKVEQERAERDKELNCEQTTDAE